MNVAEICAQCREVEGVCPTCRWCVPCDGEEGLVLCKECGECAGVEGACCSCEPEEEEEQEGQCCSALDCPCSFKPGRGEL